MRRWDPLTERQLDALRRVGNPDDEVSASDSSLARTIYALRDRGLVTTPRVDGVWTAQITDAGRFYLEHGHHPDRPGRSSDVKTKPVRSRPADQPQKPVRPQAKAVEISVEELLSRLHKDSRLHIVKPDRDTRAALRRAIHAAKQSDLVPTGMHLRHHGRDDGDLIIELVEGQHPDAKYWKDRLRVEVVDSLDQPHQVVARLQRKPEHLHVSKESLDRALRIIQSLIAEWTRRGHDADLGDGESGFVMLIRESQFTLTMDEEYKLVDHLPSPEELAQNKTYSWQRVQPEKRWAGTGRLSLELPHDYSYNGRRRRWGDRERWSLEDKLSDILSELEGRAQFDDERRIALANDKVRRQQQWESAMVQARARFVEDFKIKAIAEQVDLWDRAAKIRAYCTSLEDSRAAEGKMQDELAEWILWAKSYADRIDPTCEGLRLPEIPDPRPQDLKPYLGRWSPYGPDRQW
ncbi:hypothetical protein ACSHWB_26260 [Lentzea sp. HUAS TT2]|uniref:hypothetical protein n=1 Tax=Lentzea sp. HUAS TT2 TaxID=3447454 RepID=UPI003F72F732